MTQCPFGTSRSKSASYRLEAVHIRRDIFNDHSTITVANTIKDILVESPRKWLAWWPMPNSASRKVNFVAPLRSRFILIPYHLSIESF